MWANAPARMCVKPCARINELARQNATYYKPADSADRLRLVKMTALTPVTTLRSLNGETAAATIDPEVYITTNGRERQHNLKVLNLLQASFTNETKDQQFLDLGCGTGDFTRDHLLPRCSDVERIVAVDVSQDMLEYAKEHFAHSKICYDVLDISGNGVADFVQRYGQFDRVYSFFCLNWLVDQEKGFDNIAELMKPGGGCLLFFAASSNDMRLRSRLATITNWQKYRKALENTIPPSANLKDRDALLVYMRNLLKKTCLTVTTCEVLEVACTFSCVEELTDRLMEMCYLSTLVTDEEKPLLLEHVAKYAAESWSGEGTSRPHLSCKMFLVRADKP